MQQAEAPYERYQLHMLESLQNLSFVHASTVIAETIDETASTFGATITLDKGNSDGVQTGFAVVGYRLPVVDHFFHFSCSCFFVEKRIHFEFPSEMSRMAAISA